MIRPIAVMLIDIFLFRTINRLYTKGISQKFCFSDWKYFGLTLEELTSVVKLASRFEASSMTTSDANDLSSEHTISKVRGAKWKL